MLKNFFTINSFLNTIRQNFLLMLLLIIVFIITISIIDTSRTNNQLKQQQLQLQFEIASLKIQAQKQNLQNRFLKTDFYLDLATREQKGYVLEDETVLIIKSQKIAALKQAWQPETIEETVAISSLPNFQQWKHFLLSEDN